MDPRSRIARWWRAGRTGWRRIVSEDGEGGGLVALVGWLVGGALLGALAAAVIAVVVPVGLSRNAVVGLGLAFGGGLGVVSNTILVGTEPLEDDPTVVMADDDEPPAPRPADLFDDHPDPVLYVADEGHGPVVRAANAAFEDVFALSAETVIGAPLSDAVMVTDRAGDVVEAVADGRPHDAVVVCETAEGERRFRVRTVGGERTGYLLYTPVRDDADGR